MEKIKIGLFGFGRVGKIIANEILKDAKLELVWVVRKTPSKKKEFASFKLGQRIKKGRIFSIDEINSTFYMMNPVDVIIDFSDSQGVNSYESAAEEGICIVSAISHYKPEDFKKLEGLGKKTAVLYSPNITIGINFIMAISKVLQDIMPSADIQIVEEHFRDKKEAISGTAIKIAKLLGLDIEKHISSIRVGGIVSNHNIIFGLPNQTIRLSHENINIAAFAHGAIFAAKWVVNKAHGIYSMEDIIIENLRENMPKDEHV